MNILLTNKCNRGCPYCFAMERISHNAADSSPEIQKEQISRENFIKAVKFAQSDGGKSIGILGGEPSLHTEFIELLKIAWDDKVNTKIFTNGLWRERDIEAIENIDEKYKKYINLVVNVNQPEDSTDREKKDQEKILSRLGSYCGISFNIYREDFDPLFLIDVINRNKTRKNIRLGVAEPLADMDSNHVAIENYRKLSPTIMELVKQCDENNIRVGFDCGFLLCMFTEEEIGKLYLANARFRSSCGPTIDIGPDLSAWACFPLSTFSRGVNMEDYTSLHEIMIHFEKEFKRLYNTGAMEKCITCKYRIRKQCTGGCASHVYRSVNK